MESFEGRQLRHVVIGAGAGVLNMHLPALKQSIVKMVGVSDIHAEPGQQRAQELGCAFYTDYHQMLTEVKPDIAVITTPHPLHATIAIDCLRAGSHVLVEKPMAVQVAEADAMIETATQHKRLLGVVFQHRFRPEIQTARKLLQEGRLGALQHVEMTALWPRPASYFQQAPWRGTWAGEGGGVVMNQASHNMDVLCYLMGMPTRVVAWTRRLLHTIETEDTVQAMLEWPAGVIGSFHTSTAEAYQPEYLKIVGTGGYLEIIGGEISVQLLEMDLREFVVTSSDPYSTPASHPASVELVESTGNHIAVYRNFHDAILHGSPFTSAAAQGRMELELANAIIYSSATHTTVELPLDRQKYTSLLADLRKQAAHQ